MVTDRLRRLVSSKTAAVFAASMFATAVAAVPARAALTVTLSEPGYGSTSMTATPGNNYVTFISTFGDFATNFVIGYSNSGATPTPTAAQLQLQSLEVKSTATTPAGTTPPRLTITLTDTNFTFPGTTGSSVLLDSSIGGTLTGTAAGDNVTFQSSATPAAGTPVTTAVQSYTSPATSTGSVSFSLPDQTRLFTQAAGYSLSNTITLSLANLGDTANLSGSTTVTAVPEPVGLAAAGVAGLGLLSRRRRQA